MDTTPPSLGFAHLLAQSDAVGKTLLALLVLMSIASWALIAIKSVAHWQRQRRGVAFLTLFWNAHSMDEVQHELTTHGAHDPFSHLSAHALHAQQHHARHGATRLADAGSASAVSYTHLDVYKRQLRPTGTISGQAGSPPKKALIP